MSGGRLRPAGSIRSPGLGTRRPRLLQRTLLGVPSDRRVLVLSPAVETPEEESIETPPPPTVGLQIRNGLHSEGIVKGPLKA